MKAVRKYLLPPLFFCILILHSTSAWASGDDNAEYLKLRPLTDGLLLGGGLLLNAGDIVLENMLEPEGGWVFDVAPNIAMVNPLDRVFVFPYSGPLNTVSDILAGCALLTPAILAAAPVKEWPVIGIMYAESVIWAWGLKVLGKNLVHRLRPYMYGDEYPKDKITNGDFKQSFPSGHTTLAFTGASFCTYVFGRYLGDSPWKVPVITISWSLAAASAALRVASGSHFPTDVIAGAAIGVLSGLLVPWLHTVNTEPAGWIGSKRRSLSVTIVPSGINVKLSLNVH